jgi:outer membrane protein assembly factor BamB
MAYGKEYECCDNFFMAPAGLLDAKDGHELWRFDTPAHAFRAALLEDRVVFGTSDGTVYALAVADGKELWRMDFPGVPAQAVLAGNVVVIADADPETWGPNGIADKTRMAGRAWALDPATGEVKWQVQAGGFNAFVAANDDVVLVASYSARDQDEVVAVDAATGRERWRKTTGSVSSPPAITGQLALVPGSKLRAFDLTTGAVKWAVEPEGGGTFVFPFVSGDLVAVGTNTGPLHVRSVADGKLIAAGTIGDCSIQPFEAGAKLYTLACNGLLRVDPQGGGGAKIEPFFIPQGSVDSVAVTGDLIVFATGIGGPNPEAVLAVRP